MIEYDPYITGQYNLLSIYIKQRIFPQNESLLHTNRAPSQARIHGSEKYVISWWIEVQSSNLTDIGHDNSASIMIPASSKCVNVVPLRPPQKKTYHFGET